ncbi:type II secretion system protein [Terracidiphilus sp.]|jgi:general secretion pathway protein G|uniref:type II secretion system protein n=1 Tax=Terracidiphilus sp. TaxID=1964191 RepID=UPI003C24EC52
MRTGKPKHEAGFTLLEMMIVMTIMLVLVAVAIPAYKATVRGAREAVLKEDLHTMRSAIDSYTADKQKAPQSLDDLVQDGYLREVPVDPMTQSKDTWTTDMGDTLHLLDQTDPGVDDVHSGSQETGTDGQPYSTW